MKPPPTVVAVFSPMKPDKFSKNHGEFKGIYLPNAPEIRPLIKGLFRGCGGKFCGCALRFP